MSSVTTCPKCVRNVSLPAVEDHSSWVRCPLCHGEYTVQSALDFVPPALEVIPAPVHAAEGMFALPVGGAMAAGAVAAGMAAHLAGAHGGLGLESPGADLGHGANGAHATEHGHADSGHADAGHAGIGHAGIGRAAAPDKDDEFMFAEDSAEVDEAFGHAAHSADEDAAAMDAAEHQDDRFGADDGIALDEDHGGFGHAGDDEHEGEHAGELGGAGFGGGSAAGGVPVGSLAAMVAAQATKKKRKVPLKVKLVGALIFLVGFLIVDVVVYAGLLKFGHDPIGLKKFFPSFIVAKSLQESQTSTEPAKPKEEASIRGHLAANNPDATNPPANGTNDAKTPGVDDKQTPADNVATVKPDDKTAKPDDKTAKPDDKTAKPNPNDVASKTPDKAIDFSPDDPVKATATKPVADVFGDTKTPAATNPLDTKKPDDSKPDDSKPGDKKLDLTPVDANPAQRLGLKSEDTFTPADLDAAAAAAKASRAAYEEAYKAGDAADLNAKRIKQSRDLSHLATVLANVKVPDDIPVAQVLDTMSVVEKSFDAASALSSVDEQQQVGKLASRWIGFSGRKENGVFVVGTLKGVAPAGKLYQAELNVAGSPVTLVTNEKPGWADGTPVLVFGTIVRDPAKNLKGYDGAAETVVWSTGVERAPTAAAAPKVDAPKDAGAKDAAPKDSPKTEPTPKTDAAPMAEPALKEEPKAETLKAEPKPDAPKTDAAKADAAKSDAAKPDAAAVDAPKADAAKPEAPTAK